jgi:hypothetical protein
MSTKLCVKIGAIAGGWVGLLINLLRGFVCCTTPQPPPTLIELSGDGVLVALIVSILVAAFICLVGRRSLKPVFALALLIGVVVGAILGPVAYHLFNPGLSVFVCAILGAVLGWLICLILCAPRETAWGVSR